MKRSPLTIVVALLLIAIFGLMLFVFQVRQSEVAVVTLLDKMETDNARTNPGPHLQWPWPIERVYKLDQRVHSLEDKLEPVTLPDQNIIHAAHLCGLAHFRSRQVFPQSSRTAPCPSRKNSWRALCARPSWRWRASTISRISFPPIKRQIKFTQIENEMLEQARAKRSRSATTASKSDSSKSKPSSCPPPFPRRSSTG